MRTNQKYTESDIQRMKLYPNGKPSNKLGRNVDDLSWKEDDETVGKLHKVKVNKSKAEVKGKHYTIKQYQEALKNGTNEDEVKQIKEFYIKKGWIEDGALLPAMWLFRQKPGMTSLNFMTASGELLLSTKEANKYLENHGMSKVIDAKKCKDACGKNYEFELKRLEKKVKLEANLKKVKLE